jgi:hypothetical protein
MTNDPNDQLCRALAVTQEIDKVLFTNAVHPVECCQESGPEGVRVTWVCQCHSPHPLCEILWADDKSRGTLMICNVATEVIRLALKGVGMTHGMRIQQRKE